MRRVEYLPAAKRDITEIARFIRRSSGSREVAERFDEALRHQCSRLAELPGTLGRARPGLDDIRSFAFREYLIFFRYARNDVLQIIRIIERHRDHVAQMDKRSD